METKKYAQKNSLAHEFLPLLITGGAMANLSACARAIPSPFLILLIIQFSGPHSTQFTGFYAANQNGDYIAEALAVTLIEGCPNLARQTSVLNGAAQFGPGSESQLIPAQTNISLYPLGRSSCAATALLFYPWPLTSKNFGRRLSGCLPQPFLFCRP